MGIDRRLRIAHVSDCFAPRTGGIETQVAALAEQQRRAGHLVRVITATPTDPSADAAVDVAVPVERITVRLPGDLPIHPRTRARVLASLRADPVDVVHIHAGVVSPFAWGAARAVRAAGLPGLVTVHCVWGPLARPGFAVADGVIGWTHWGLQLAAVSDMAAATVARALPRAAPVLVTPNGIDPEAWRTTPIPGSPNVLRAVTVSRLAPRKRILALMDIWAAASKELAARGIRLEATLVGDGPLRERAERRARDRGLDVRFTGRLNPVDIRPVFASADVFVQPSVRESFGIAALEARTAGLPVIARSQTGSTAFITDGRDGVLVDDDDGVVEALVRIGVDPQLRATLTTAARSEPTAQGWPAVLEAVDRAYRAAIARRP